MTAPGDVAREVLALPHGRVIRVGIDGVDGAGKTTFADALAAELKPSGRQVIRASVDDFHRPRALRYARGRHSPEGFFLDSFDYGALLRELLDPLGPGGTRRFRRRWFDLECDEPDAGPSETAAPDAILVVDGLFLHRDELRRVWDYSVFLDVPFEVSCARMAARDGTSPDPAAASNRRYVQAQLTYLAACDPRGRATRVLDNTRRA